jgi:agmatine deiminase
MNSTKRWTPFLRTVAAALCLSAAAGSLHADERTWRMHEERTRGDLSAMLKTIAESPAIPQLRLTRSAAELTSLLSRVGRFRQLGLTDAQGAVLVEAVYRKHGLPLTGIAPRSADGAPVTPAALAPIRYRAGTEFENLSRVLMRWPFDWAALVDEYATLIKHMTAGGVTVQIRVDTTTQRDNAAAVLTAAGVPMTQILWTVRNTDSVWMRDYGPQFLYGISTPEKAIADFHYYSSRPNDDAIPAFLAAQLGQPVVDRQNSSVVYTEGGNLSHDGLGLVMYTERTYTKNRAPSALVDFRILTAFQAAKNIVLKDPRLDSTGHIDMFTKVVNASTVIVGQYNPDQIDYAVLEQAATVLRNSTNGAGTPWNVVRMPQPDVYYAMFLLPVVRTYTNSQFANNTVVVPVYGLPTDETALSIYRSLMPGRTVIGVNANDIIESGGAWHCIAMEMPSGGV